MPTTWLSADLERIPPTLSPTPQRILLLQAFFSQVPIDVPCKGCGPNLSMNLPDQSVSSVTQSCLILCDPRDCSMPGLPMSITGSRSLLKLMSIELVMPSNYLILCYPLLPPSIFPNQFFESVGQSIGVSASASVLPMNIQDWFPLGWTSLTSLQSKGLSRVFSNTTVQKHQFFGTQLSL